MKNLTIFLFAFILCSCNKAKPDLIISGEKKEGAQHLGSGVWIMVPNQYSKAKSYEGFQAGNGVSSISLQVNNTSLASVKNSYNEGWLAENKSELIEMRNVKFATLDSAIYTEVYDKRKQTIRYTLSIKKDDAVYSIKAFCFKVEEKSRGKMLIEALESTFFGEVVVEKETFQLVDMQSMDKQYYTKDGLMPTKSDDMALIEITLLEFGENNVGESKMRNILNQNMAKINKEQPSNFGTQKLSNGIMYFGESASTETKVYGVLLAQPSGNAMMVICQGKSNKAISEFKEFVRAKFLSETIN